MVRAEPARHAAADQAVGLARELARLLDHVRTERLDFAALEKLVPEEFAEHWQRTLRFLKIVTDAWPRALEEEGRLDAADRRNRLLAARAEAWRKNPPPGPVIAAGTTGTVPATADLLETVLALPGGAVVLPGLDRELDDAAWDALEPSHPQFGMARLLKRLNLQRGDVPDWDAPGVDYPPPHRTRLLAAALRPAKAGPHPKPVHAAALDGVTRIDCPTPHEEAGAIALILRQTLEDEDRTAALITPDRTLARRVAAEMRRFGVEVDDSAGCPLDQTPPGAFLRLLARAAAEDFVPVPLLALLKHPLAGGGLAAGEFRTRVRALELAALRGPRPASGLKGLAAAAAGDARAREVVAILERALGRFAELARRGNISLAELATAHIAAAESLAADLWAGEAGEAAAAFAAELIEAADAIGAIEGGAYPAVLESLMAGRAVHPRYGLHPRVHIWGLLEARLQRADVMVLGGLNEGAWPPDAEASPWMSRPMMTRFGLPSPERRIGLAAHDFVQAFAAPVVYATRSERVEGAPTVPSRWLLKIENLARGLACAPFVGNLDWPHWQALLDAPAAVAKIKAPAPTPPVAARPKQLSVTQIEAWMRDPYAIYARHILRLRALDPLDAQPDAANYGTFIHAALDAFVNECPPPAPLPGDALDRLLACGQRAFAQSLDRPGVWAFWWPRFERIARWFVAVEAERRARDRIAVSVTETEGRLTIPGPAGDFALTAKADRIDRDAAGRLILVDYKTGTPPSEKEIIAGFAPQLPLEAMIAEAGGFARPGAGEVARLEHWKLGGGDEPGTIKPVKADAGDLIAKAREGLANLISVYADPNTPYPARPRPEQAPRYSDYEHLARVKEWAAGEDGGDE
ncbi:MAG: double-strand break repair protein AddB [Alphaproteobacteria bacterium]|nr:double-strand break repair protein AddB [Alphaproteobacteria bacterium]